MSLIIGHRIIKGVPYINGKKAIFDENNPFPDVFSNWRCPECSAYLSLQDKICLNACHLTVPQFKKMQNDLREAQIAVEERDRQAQIEAERRAKQSNFANWLEG